MKFPFIWKMTMVSYAWQNLESKICFWMANFLKLLHVTFSVKIPGSYFVAFISLKFTNYHVTSKGVKSIYFPLQKLAKSNAIWFFWFTNFLLFTLFFDTAKILGSTHVLRNLTDGASNRNYKMIFIMVVGAQEVAK